MSTFFEGKLIVVTGAASGIGRATVKILARHGALLSLADVNEDNLKAVKDEVLEIAAARNATAAAGGDSSNSDNKPAQAPAEPVFTAVVDVRSQESCNRWIRDTLQHFESAGGGGGQQQRRIAGAANLAGVSNPPGRTEPVAARDIADPELEFVWDVNVRGVVNSLRAELPHLQEGNGGRGGASVVNAGSISGLMGLPGYLPYVSSKHAVIGITRTAAKEEGPKAIRINAIAPGMIDTPLLRAVAESRGVDPSHEMFGSSAGPSPALDRLGEAEEVAEVIVFLLSPQSGYINGAVIPIDGGLLI
ncbi:hypothetical protein KVR01_006061 [Diaporthe batatas]|uniref:uncharacterized protein n=1 Tax=Diaporthe batatas TaxID=748121 RepID=UPI001D03B498|nr:uncharacterized protein KVR01_006061 [Diaporthe batatas]KAG8164143.1 hypothetical protein KVR01_006061 [Diaporthe batatas]